METTIKYALENNRKGFHIGNRIILPFKCHSILIWYFFKAFWFVFVSCQFYKNALKWESYSVKLWIAEFQKITSLKYEKKDISNVEKNLKKIIQENLYKI